MSTGSETIPENRDGSKAAHTPGPWRWEINLTARQVQLCGGDPKSGFGAYDHTVMDFVRWGMSGAQPRFLDAKATLLTEASTFAEVVEGREHHKSWFQTLSHPDARLIAAAPDLLEALKGLHDDIVSYIEVNKLHDADGKPAIHNHWMVRARSAIQRAGSEQ